MLPHNSWSDHPPRFGIPQKRMRKRILDQLDLLPAFHSLPGLSYLLFPRLRIRGLIAQCFVPIYSASHRLFEIQSWN